MREPDGGDIAAALDRSRDDLMALPGVVACGIGADDGQACIRVYTDPAQKTARTRLPSAIDGFPVREMTSGALRSS